MSIFNEAVWTREQLEALQEFAEQIRRVKSILQVWTPNGGYPGLVPAAGIPADSIVVETDETSVSLTEIYQQITSLQETISTGIASIYRGFCSANGSLVKAPENWIGQRTSVGMYRFTHNLGLEHYSDLIVIPSILTIDTDRTVKLFEATSTSFTIYSHNTSEESAADSDVMFIAMRV